MQERQIHGPLTEGHIVEACHGVQLSRDLLNKNFYYYGPGFVLDHSSEACKLLEEADAALNKLYQHIGDLEPT